MSQTRTEGGGSLSQSLYNELEALKIRIAFAEIDEEETAKLEKALAELCEKEYTEAAQREVLADIQRRFDRRARRRFVKKTLPFTAQVFAAVLLVFFLTLTTATATVHSVRVKLLNFIMEIEERYTALSLEETDGDYTDVPAEWQGNYYPSYIPEGFSLTRISRITNDVQYNSGANLTLEFCEYDSADYVNIDTEDSTISDISIHNITAIAAIKDGGINIIWSEQGTYFTLFYSGDAEEAKKIAESVQRIRK